MCYYVTTHSNLIGAWSCIVITKLTVKGLLFIIFYFDLTTGQVHMYLFI